MICNNKARNILIPTVYLLIHNNKSKKKGCRVCRENCQSYRPLQQITWHDNIFGVLTSVPKNVSSFLPLAQMHTAQVPAFARPPPPLLGIVWAVINTQSLSKRLLFSSWPSRLLGLCPPQGS